MDNGVYRDLVVIENILVPLKNPVKIGVGTGAQGQSRGFSQIKLWGPEATANEFVL